MDDNGFKPVVPTQVDKKYSSIFRKDNFNGSNIGLLMKRGTIIIKNQKFLAPHFNYNGTNEYIFLKIMEFYLEKISKEFKNIFPSIYTKKYLGDVNCKGMGEVLIIS